MSDEEIRPKGSWLARRVGAPRAGAVPQRETVRAKPGDPLERSRGRLVVVAGGFAALFAAVVVKLTLATVILPVAPKQVAAVRHPEPPPLLPVLAAPALLRRRSPPPLHCLRPSRRPVQDGWTALMHAAVHGHADAVRLLLAAPGVDVNAKGNKVRAREG